MAADPPKVLISYSHDSPEHAQHVLELAERLRKDGVDAQLDQYVAGTPPEGWPRWMLNQLNRAEFVLVVCTETYYRRFRGHEEPGKGKGADWEGNLVTTEMYNAKSRSTKFVPVFFASQDEQFIPEPISGHTNYLLDSQNNYGNLYAFLTGQAGVPRGELGSLKPLAHTPVEPLRFGTLSNLPERNPFFTGREPVLAQIQEGLVVRGRVALSGLGGVGKTQTAMEYAHRHSAEYANVFWTTADSHKVSQPQVSPGEISANPFLPGSATPAASLVSGYVTIATLLKLSQADAHDQTATVEAVKRWFGSHRDWLLVLDNADSPQIVKPFLPTESKGHVLLTSRAQVFDTIGIVKPVELNEMSPAEARTFLLKRTGREYEGGPEPNAASELAAELGFLPLALEQAGAYIVHYKSLFQDYSNSFRKRKLELLNKHGPVAGDYHESVRTTWSMNFRQLEKESEAAADLLRLSAFLSPDSIPLEFLATGAPELGNLLAAALADVQEDPVVLDETLAPLTNFSLIRRQIETRSYSVHRLVQAVVRAEMDPGTQRSWAERAVRAVSGAFPSVEFSTWAGCERLLSQAHACAELINQWSFEFPEAVRLLNEAGFYLYERGRYTDAKPLYERALAIREKALGPEHPDVATSLDKLAVLYHVQGQSKKAEPSFERALAIREKALGPDHTAVASSLHNLARSHRVQGRYAEAEPLYRRALAIREKALGPEHPDVALSLNNLAALYKNQGQYAKAEPLYNRALAMLEKALDPNDRRVAWTLHSVASLYRDERQYDKAEPHYKRALAIWEKALGPEHPDVGQTLHGMAQLYDAQGQYAKAESFYERALAIWEKAFGPVHPKVATALGNYASLLRNMGRSEEAEPLEARVREIRARSA
jgi:tetratricopeptide (TPR) repeat protein